MSKTITRKTVYTAQDGQKYKARATVEIDRDKEFRITEHNKDSSVGFIRKIKNLEGLKDFINFCRTTGAPLDMSAIPKFGKYNGDTKDVLSWDENWLLVECEDGTVDMIARW